MSETQIRRRNQNTYKSSKHSIPYQPAPIPLDQLIQIVPKIRKALRARSPSPEETPLNIIIRSSRVLTRLVDIQSPQIMLRRQTGQAVGKISFDGRRPDGDGVAGEICDGVGREDCVEEIELFEIYGYGEEAEGLLDAGYFFG